MFGFPKALSLLLACGVLAADLPSRAADPHPAAPPAHPGFVSNDDYFLNEVWTKVASRTCLKCHRAGGDAEESDFILQEPIQDLDAITTRNRAAFAKMAAATEDGVPRMLRKVIGELDHGGEDVLTAGSSRYRILAEWVERVTGRKPESPRSPPQTAAAPQLPFFDGVAMIDDRRLLRRLTLSLAARLPTPEEDATIAAEGLAALPPVLDTLMGEDAFYERLAEAFNDIFLTTGYDDVAENALSYEHFETTRHWYQHWDFSHIEDERERERAGWTLAREYRESMLREPMELVKYIVRNGRPFTEIITADYIMVSPYTARGYGIFDEVRGRFSNIDDRFEYIPVRLQALKGRSRTTDQESPTGFYPHAGLLSTFQYLKRYPTTETNRNRLRVRMYFQQFLGVDIMQLAPRVNDAAAASAQYETPTMQAADCVVCHKIIDPVAGLFQDYYALDGEGVHLRRRDGWFTDIFPPGHGGEALPEPERWRALQWLGERTADDPRFALAMVGHAWYLLTGRHPLDPPQDIDDPLFAPRQRAYSEQRKEFEGVAKRFAASGFILKSAIQELALSPFYRADSLATAVLDPARQAELDDLGLARLLAPEQLERKIAAVFGKRWDRLKEQYEILYGGIDAQEITERIADPGGAMGALQRMMANEVACKNVAADFLADPDQRRLFPHIEPDLVPDADDPETTAAIRAAIVHLHGHVLGRHDSATSPEVDRTYALFAGIVADAETRGGFEPHDIYSCRDAEDRRVPDPHYTLRAWRAVVTYLLRQHEFLYE